MENEPEHIERLWENAHFMMKGYRDLGFNIGGTQTPIIPIIVRRRREVLPPLEGALRERRLYESCHSAGRARGARPAPDELYGLAYARAAPARPRRVREGGEEARGNLTSMDGRIPLYEKFAHELEERILAGTFPEGGRVPALRESAAQRGLSLSTVLQAIASSRRRGIIEARPQSGYYVKVRPRKVPSDPSPPPRRKTRCT